jgi:FMN-dependent dehydrogenase
VSKPYGGFCLPAFRILSAPITELTKDRPRRVSYTSPSSVHDHIIHFAQQYVHYGYDATALFRRLAEIACHDNFTEMHAFKHHQAIVEEFSATREPWRSRPLYWGLAVNGAEGVHGMLELLRQELDQTPGYCGQTDVRHLEPCLVTVPSGWGNGTM